VPISWGVDDIERLVQLMFENMNVPGLYVADSALMAVYGCGVLSGLVIDIGHETMCKD
jgi:actin-related protein